MKTHSIPLTDILVVTYNAKLILGRCLRSVIRHTRGLPYRLTVVDNASTDGTSDYLRACFGRECRLIHSPRNLGFSGGANLALRHTDRPWIVLLDDDAEVTPGWLRKLHALAQKHPRIGIVGGKVVFPDRRIFCAEYKITPFGSAGFGELDRGQRDYTREVDALPGPCWLLRRSVIDLVGYFDERFFPSQYEDIDYCLRARLAGYKIFYHGAVRILHSHLYRSGPQGAASRNEVRFFKKWRKRLRLFPLCPSRPDDRRIADGAKRFEKETFCRSHHVLGKVARLSGWFPAAFYKGVSYLASGENKNAVREFRSVAKRVWKETNEVCGEIIYLHRVLSIYFSRLGLKDQAARHAVRILDVIRMQGSTASFMPKRHPWKPVTMRLHDWRIRIVSDEPEFFRALKKFLPYDWRRLRPASSGRGGRLLEILFSNKTDDSWKAPVCLTKGLVPSYFSTCGIYRIFDPKNLRVFVAMNKKKYLRDNWLFHASFLWPLEHLLRLEDASFVHGALLQKDGQGILVLGQKGAGKSTLSTVCLKRGFRYFSDEHPILELHAGRVRGKSFVSPIALPAVSAGNFISLRKKMTWSTGRQKYLLDAPKVWPGCVGGVTGISRVVFPRFDLHGKLSVRRLKKGHFFKRLLQDEYLSVLLPHEQKNPERSVPRRLAALLSRTARGFTITYGPRDIQRLPAIFERL